MALPAPAFDTHAYVKRLKAAGFNEAQAEAQAELQAEILCPARWDGKTPSPSGEHFSILIG